MAMLRKYVISAIWGLVFFTVLLASAGIGMVGVVAWQVFYGDHSELQKSTILAKIKEETTLYYLDEKTRIGSIFESRHRRYVPISEVPAHMVDAIIAAEDKNFYQHFGIDPLAISKALMEGLANGGHFRRGGSTITQQTVKNVIDDWEASFSRKFREMIKSLQLERLYDKKQILEFYLNQFHVAGNGNGIGIAARYYFNKDVHELNLVEAAFIAGSVKGPGKYNPFIKYTKKTREQAKIFANQRKNYVLGRMYEQGLLSKKDYQEGLKTAVVFNRGEFRTAEVALVELVRTQLEKPEVLDALGLKTPDDLNIAGMRVFTTLDADLQLSAQFAMRKNLSRLETILSGFRAESPDFYQPMRDLQKDTFLYGKVEAIEGHDYKDYALRLSFGLPMGTIPNASLLRYAKLLNLAVEKGERYYLEQIIGQIRVGDVLFVEVVDYDKETNEAVLELQKRPKISGGMIALDKGEVRAVVSGFDTLGFNRAMYAKRQPGSLFKSLIFFAALQLGWSMLDRIENVRQLFPYQGKFYYPRPDHKSPYENVSMMWAGVMSENLASVALGARLLEKINFEQFKTLLHTLDLAPQPGEIPRDYHYRVARKIGVSLDNEGIRAGQLVAAIDEIAPDLIFAGKQHVLSSLKLMWLGRGYLSESVRLRGLDPYHISEHEKQIRLRLLLNNFERMQKLYTQLEVEWPRIEQAIHSQGLEKAFSDPQIRAFISHFRVLGSNGIKPELGFTPILAEEAGVEQVRSVPLVPPQGRELNILDVQAIWGGESPLGGASSAGISFGDVKLAAYLDARIFSQLAATLERRYQTVMAGDDPYLLGRYFQHYDFRIGLGLHYVVQMSQAAGIYSKLEPVLSFPLGSNDVTAAEVAKLYQTFVSGKTYRFYKEGPDNQINFIRRIEDRHGKILYEPKVEEHQLVDPLLALQMREILRKTVTHGTGRRARGELYINLDESNPTQQNITENSVEAQTGTRIRVPAFGKTGTTNDFITSYFAGFVPYPTAFGKPLDPDNSYVISSYVGYDFNKVMQRGRQRIYGGTGALPMWTDFAKSIIETKAYKDLLDPLDISVIANKEWPTLSEAKRSNQLLVDLPRGLVLRSSQREDSEVWQTTDLAATGESYQDPYALDGSVKSVVNVPTDRAGGSLQPLRLFGLFQVAKPDGSSSAPQALPLTSKVEPALAAPEASPSPVATEQAQPATEMPGPAAATTGGEGSNPTEYNEADDLLPPAELEATPAGGHAASKTESKNAEEVLEEDL